jgi:hypothetical protein
MGTALKIAGSSLIGLAAMTGVALAAGPAAPHGVPTAAGLNKLTCFDGTTDGGFGGTCTLNSNGAKGSATLSLTSTSTTGDYAGVYVPSSVVYGQKLSDVTQLSYHYAASITPLPGDLSYNIPIDENGDGTTEGYAFVDAYYCPGTDGVVNITTDVNCGIWYQGVEYANWAAFVAAFPDARIATDNYVFVIAERTPSEPAATYTVNNVKFGKAGK